MYPNNRSLVLAAVVILLALLSLQGHPQIMPPVNNWAGPNSVSFPFMAHMAALQLHRISAAVSSVITIR
jgi:hypothetical protein